MRLLMDVFGVFIAVLDYFI